MSAPSFGAAASAATAAATGALVAVGMGRPFAVGGVVLPFRPLLGSTAVDDGGGFIGLGALA